MKSRPAVTRGDRLSLWFCLVCILLFINCKNKVNPEPTKTINPKSEILVDQEPQPLDSQEPPIADSGGTTIKSRFQPPDGFIRTEFDPKSYASFLRNFPLLKAGEKVHLYNGDLKGIQSVHAAVLDIDVGTSDLQQCADAVMRLRSEYLWKQKAYDNIAFNFTNGWEFEYSKWRAGNDLLVNGNKTSWSSGSTKKESYEDFRAYLNWVFMYAGTLSLSKELKPKRLQDIEIGDVFIYGGSPGHAVQVVDVATNPETGDKAFLIAQSYMPAQQMHVLKNPTNSQMSPWYVLSEIKDELITPEWTFAREALKTF